MCRVLLNIAKRTFNCSRVRVEIEGVRKGFFTDGATFGLEAFLLEVGMRNVNKILIETKVQRSVNIWHVARLALSPRTN